MKTRIVWRVYYPDGVHLDYKDKDAAKRDAKCDGARLCKVTITSKPGPKASFTLKLSSDEATALWAVLQSVGGSPETTARRHTDSLADKLRSKNVTKISLHGLFTPSSSVLYFAKDLT